MANNRCLDSTKMIFGNLFEGIGTTSLGYLIGNSLSSLLLKISINDKLAESSLLARIIFLVGFCSISGYFSYQAATVNEQKELRLRKIEAALGITADELAQHETSRTADSIRESHPRQRSYQSL